MAGETPKLVDRVAESLKAHRQDWEPHYKLLEQHFLPRNSAFSSDPATSNTANRGKLINRKMLNSTPMRALRVLKSGLQAGVTSPSRPWFRLQPSDPGKRERPAVKEYMWKAQTEMRRIMERSGLYNMLHNGYGHLGVYGVECSLIEDHGPMALRGYQMKPGSFWLGMSNDRDVDTCYREFGMTVNQIVGKFVYGNNKSGDPDWNAVPPAIKDKYDKGQIGEIETVCQLIMPRRNRDALKINKENKPIASLYWLKDDSRDTNNRPLLGNGGYNTNPISASRWEVDGYEVYGYSPAMETLPDVQELMTQRRDYLEMLRRVNRPPMNAHTDLRTSAFSLAPGAVNYMADPSKGLTPAYQVDPQLAALREDAEVSKDSIWSGMYADLFMMISQLDRRQITATEIDERREEKLIALGPVLERLHFEKLKPLVERLYITVVNSGVIGPPPEELRGEEVEIDFISMLAQAQKAVATGGMERLVGFVGNLAAAKPEVLDKIDEDATVSEYADMLGVPVNVVRSDDDAQALRRRRQEAEARMQQAEQAEKVAGAANQGAQAAKVLSEADSPRGMAPADILNRTNLGL
jgi:hypothetical protein